MLDGGGHVPVKWQFKLKRTSGEATSVKMADCPSQAANSELVHGISSEGGIRRLLANIFGAAHPRRGISNGYGDILWFVFAMFCFTHHVHIHIFSNIYIYTYMHMSTRSECF